MQKLLFLNKKEKIKNLAFVITDVDKIDYTSSGYGLVFRSVKEDKKLGEGLLLLEYLDRSKQFPQYSVITLSSDECLDQILFYIDLLNWEQIKDLTLPEYYHQQLEMFNFALPADNLEPQS